MVVGFVAQRLPPQPPGLARMGVSGAVRVMTIGSSSTCGTRAPVLFPGRAGRLAGTYRAPLPIGVFQIEPDENGWRSGSRPTTGGTVGVVVVVGGTVVVVVGGTVVVVVGGAVVVG